MWKIQYRDLSLRIETESDFYSFYYHSSANGIYVLCFVDDNGMPGIGNFILLKNNSLFTAGNLVKPSDGLVGNNGNFVLNSCGETQKPSGTFFALTEMGTVLIEQHFKAGLGPTGLSPSGRHAVVQTFWSNTEKYNNILTLYSLEYKRTLWSIKGGPNMPRSFIIHDEDSIIIKYKVRGDLRLNWNGRLWINNSFLCAEPWIDER